MARKKAPKPLDITSAGKQSYVDLQQINAALLSGQGLTTESNEPYKNLGKWFKGEMSTIGPVEKRSPMLQLSLLRNDSELDYWGNSIFDDEVLVDNESQRNLADTRAENQPWYAQLASGIGKMVTTAGTTFIDGTLGTLWGIGTGIKNLFDDDPDTGFWRGMWDNQITNAMSEVTDWTEKVMPNYMTEWEQNTSFLQRAFSGAGAANFWGNDILKNAGFTLGAAASIYATGGAASALKGLKGISTIGRGLGLVTRGADEALHATKAGKVASWLGKTFVSTNGEASLEALNATKDNARDMENNLNIRTNQLYQLAQQEAQALLESGVDPSVVQGLYNEATAKILTDADAYRKQMQRELTDAGNTIYAANVAALALSNNLTLGSMIRGGYGTSKSLLENAVKTAGGKPVNTVKEGAEALLKGDLLFAAKPIKHQTAKIAGRYMLNATLEGLEETTQNLASSTAQIATLAKMNKWADSETMLGSMINPEAEEKYVNYSTAFNKALQDNFGALNSQGWTEAAAGFISGLLGIPFVGGKASGKTGFKWLGGLSEAFEDITGQQREVQRAAETMNKALSSNKFGDRVKHAVQQMAIRDALDLALENSDVRSYKNLEVQQLVNDALFFRNMGLLDEYMGMYESFGRGITDEDVVGIRAASKDEKTGKSALDGMTDDQIKETYRDKAISTLEKVKLALDRYDTIADKYADSFKNDSTRQLALMEMTYLDTLYWDTNRRKEEIETKLLAQQDDYENGKLSPIEKVLYELDLKALEDLDRQLRRTGDRLQSYIDNPEQLELGIQKLLQDKLKEHLYSQANVALEHYKNAKTLNDVKDIYEHQSEESRDEILNLAISLAEDEDTKGMLKSFKDYMGDVNTLEDVINSKYPILNEDSTVNLNNAIYNKFFNDVLENAKAEMLNGDALALSRKNLAAIFKKGIENLKEQSQPFQYTKEKVKAVDGGYQFLNEDELSPNDFEEIIDDPETGASHRQAKEGSEAEALINEFQLALRYDDLINKLQELTDSLDKLDELRKSVEKTKKNKEEKRKEKKDEKKSEPKKKETTPKPASKPKPEPVPESTIDTSSIPAVVSDFYTVEPMILPSGLVLNIITLKEGATAPKETADNLLAQLQKLIKIFNVFEDGEGKVVDLSDEEGTKRIKELYDVIKNTYWPSTYVKDNFEIFNDVKESLDNIFNKYKHLLPQEKEGDDNPPPADGSTINIEDTTKALAGNQISIYTKKELEEGKAIPYVQEGSVNDWLLQHGHNIQHIIDNYIPTIIKNDSKKPLKDRTPIYYLHNAETPDVVYLGIEYTPDIAKIIPEDLTKVFGVGDSLYILVGTLGYSNSAVKPMFENILDRMLYLNNGDSWAIDTENTNRIKDITSGYKVTQLGNDNRQSRDVKELITTESPNPNINDIHDLRFAITMGNDEDPGSLRVEMLDGYNEDAYEGFYTFAPKYAGQVFMYIPDGKGMGIPTHLLAVYFNELDETTALSSQIKDLVNIIADKNKSFDDKKFALAELRDILQFSRPNQLHINDESYATDPFTVYITRNGIAEKVGNLDTVTADEILDAIRKINPRINIDRSTLETNPEFYLDSGVLRTNIASLSTLGSGIYVYPVNEDLNYIENKPYARKEKISGIGVQQRLYLNSKYVYYDGNKFTDAEGNIITDQTYKAALDIKNGKYKSIEYGNGIFYDTAQGMFVETGHGGFNIETDENKIKKIRLRAKNEQKLATRKKNVEKATKIAEKKEDVLDIDLGITEDIKSEESSTTPKEDSVLLTGNAVTGIANVASDNDLEKKVEASSKTIEGIIVANRRDPRVRELCQKLGANNPAEAAKAIADKIDVASADIKTLDELLEHCK